MTVSSSSTTPSGTTPSSPSPSPSVVDVDDDGSVPPFSLTGDRYDQTTFYGRYLRMLDLVDPRTLFCSQQDLDNAVQVLNDFAAAKQQQQQQNGDNTVGKNNATTDTNATTTNSQLWHAKKIRDAVFHPDTNEIIPKPFRMSGFLPFNSPLCVGALMAASTPSVLFFQWANQTHNALINYYNRNATQPLETSTVLQGYFGAVTGAIGIAMGLKTAIERSTRLDVVQKVKYQRFVALPAITVAAAINVILMRRGELTTGIDIYYNEQQQTNTNANTNANNTNTNTNTNTNNTNTNDDDDDDYSHPPVVEVVAGSSQIAAKKALTEMTISRMILPMPVFLAPPIGLSLVDAIMRKYSNNKKGMNTKFTLPLNAAFVLLGFGLGLPATIALFPQIGTVEVSDLEEKFQNLRDKQGNPVKVFRYNKGL